MEKGKWLCDVELGMVQYGFDSTIHLTTTKYEALAQNKEKLIHELDKLFTHGQMGDNTKIF